MKNAPLTKEFKGDKTDIMKFVRKRYHFEEDVLSALKGLKEEIKSIENADYFILNGKRSDKIWTPEMCFLMNTFKGLIDKWFPILKEEK